MENYRINELSVQELTEITGGDIFKRFGRWLGELWNDMSCECNNGSQSISQMYDDMPPA